MGAGYHVLWFAPEQPIDVRAGHFTMIRSVSWGLAPLLPRPMSLLTGGSEPSILIKVVGEGTRRMAFASKGEEFALLAPLGTPWRGLPEGHRAVLVAGGVGVAPLLFLARELSAAGADVTTLYGGRSAQDLPLSDELAACGTLQVTTEDGSRGTRGRVTVLLEQILADGGGDVKIYTCGPHAMMAAVAKMAAQAKTAGGRGVLCDASLEAPMGCGYGVCLGCPVTRSEGGYLYTCVDGPCIDATRVDWSKGVF
ncbi:hypothetical protein JYT28_01585 [Desulfobulbus sp. AH-315-M07]|nr:hypothetical protein [Desulfobulbus sp. AH-315-M07]